MSREKLCSCPAALPFGVPARCFLRSYFLIAAYNPQGLQNIGFMYAVEPALAALYGPGEDLAAARMRYAGRFNCHPFLAPLLMGIFLHMEAEIAAGRLPVQAGISLKDAASNALSAIGDSFFTGSLLVSWALASSILITAGLPAAAGVFTALLFLMLQAFRAVSFSYGLRKGFLVLGTLKKWDLADKGEILKQVNGLLAALFLYAALPGNSVPEQAAVTACLLLAGWLVGKIHVPRLFIVFFLMATAAGLHWSGVLQNMHAP